MIIIRKLDERGKTQTDWLKSFHSFSFADYYDPEFMGFGNLRVINEDTIQPGQGFGTHPHRDMEIITYVVDGALEHKDSMGTGSVIKPGEIQKMSAGTGVMHSEFNHSKTDLLHLLQIWIIPKEFRLKPNYEQKTIPKENNQLILIGAPNDGDHAVTIHQDAKLFVAYLAANASVTHTFEKNHTGWLQLIKGKIKLDDKSLSAGDGAAIFDEDKIAIQCIEPAELLLFDLA